MTALDYLQKISYCIPKKSSYIIPITYEPVLESGDICLGVPLPPTFTSICSDDSYIYDSFRKIYYKNHCHTAIEGREKYHKIVKKSDVTLSSRVSALSWKSKLRSSIFFSLFTTQYDVVFISATGSCLTDVTDYFSDIDLIVWCNNRIPGIEYQADLELLIDGVRLHWSYRDISHFLIDIDDFPYRIPAHSKFFEQKVNDLLYVSPKYHYFVEALLNDNEARDIAYSTIYHKFSQSLGEGNSRVFTYWVLECNRGLLPDNIDSKFLYNIKKGVATEEESSVATKLAESFIRTTIDHDDLKSKILKKNKQIYSKLQNNI